MAIVYYLRPINLFIIFGIAVWMYLVTFIVLRTFTKRRERH
ncbi:MAG: hypothetical protein ABSD89_14130 [Halobacteriota archaeon]